MLPFIRGNGHTSRGVIWKFSVERLQSSGALGAAGASLAGTSTRSCGSQPHGGGLRLCVLLGYSGGTLTGTVPCTARSKVDLRSRSKLYLLLA